MTKAIPGRNSHCRTPQANRQPRLFVPSASRPASLKELPFQYRLMLKLPQPIYNHIRRHGEEAYPEESCGILLGVVSGNIHDAREAIRCRNIHPSAGTNYEMDLREVIRLQREARERGLEIIGFYHSHPDHPASPSPTDIAQAHWLGCSYVIISVESGRADTMKSFYLAGPSEEDKVFVNEEVTVSGKSLIGNC